MAGTTPGTIGALALQISRMASEQADLRVLVLDVLKEMLRISAMQAEATNSFLRLVEDQQKLFAAQQNIGAGRSSERSEQAEYQTWRAELEAARLADRPSDEPMLPFDRDF